MSFLDKLKKSMGVEEIEEAPEESIQETPKKTKKPAVTELRIQKKPIAPEPSEPEKTSPELLAMPKPLTDKKEKEKEKWFEPEGQLAIDMYQTETGLIIQSAIAGVSLENLDIVMERDVITIRGIRAKPFEEEGDYFIQECYWGAFSREVILPVEVDPDRAEASMKEGILTIRLPKILREKRRRIKIRA